MSSKKKDLTLFFISVFLHFVFFINSIKSFTLCFTSMHEQLLFVFWQSSHTRTWLPFTAVSICAWLTPRWFIEALRCIYDLVHSEFPISALPCCTDLIMISARVLGLRSLENNVFYNSWPAEKCKNFLNQRHFLYIHIKNEKYPVLHGHYWTQKDTDWSWRQDARSADFPFA